MTKFNLQIIHVFCNPEFVTAVALTHPLREAKGRFAFGFALEVPAEKAKETVSGGFGFGAAAQH